MGSKSKRKDGDGAVLSWPKRWSAICDRCTLRLENLEDLEAAKRLAMEHQVSCPGHVVHILSDWMPF